MKIFTLRITAQRIASRPDASFRVALRRNAPLLPVSHHNTNIHFHFFLRNASPLRAAPRITTLANSTK